MGITNYNGTRGINTTSATYVIHYIFRFLPKPKPNTKKNITCRDEFHYNCQALLAAYATKPFKVLYLKCPEEPNNAGFLSQYW